jgi:hypothetical protein
MTSIGVSQVHCMHVLCLCRYAHVFTMDSGNSLGTISGHAKMVNTCAYRPARPFRILTASEDNSVGFHEGPPFKFKRTQRVRKLASAGH